MAVGKTPLSVEDILAKQKAEKEEASKPKFLTKAQRAQIALEKRQQEIAASQDKQAAERAEREKLEQSVEEERRRNDSYRYGGPGGNGQYGGPQGGRYGQQSYQAGNRGPHPNQRAYNRGLGAPSGPRNNGGPPPSGPRNGGYVPSPLSGAGGGSSGRNGDNYQSTPIPTGPRNGTNSMPGPPNQDNPTVTASPSRTFDNPTDGMPSIGSSAAPPTDAELAIIRQRYLGAAPPGEAGPAAKKPRARKLQDKKFVFDWDASEDTSSAEVGTWRDEMANGNRAVGVGVGTMFGGRLAGYDEGGRSKATSRALEDHHADALERRRAAKHGHDDRHWTEKPLVEMKDRDWRIFREDFSISARGGNIPHPMRNWRESGIPEAILNIIDEIGYKEPSPIQRQAIPIGLKNRDLIGIAQTGSGKTASFVIPMLEYISHLAPLTEENMHLGPYALIMAPTRELAQQIESETKRFAGPMGYKTVSIVGGKAVEEQQFNLREGAEIVIATPGRLKDIIDRNIMVLSQCRYVVMDEADRMVDLGFEEELNYILGSMPADYAKPEDVDVDDYVDPNPELDKNGGPQTGWKGLRVTTLFSATMPPIVERLARKYLRKPATVVIGNAGEAVETVEQRVEFIQGDEKRKLKLQEILRTIGLPPPMIVFVNQKKTADMVVKYVQQAGRRGVTLHSGKNQEQREAALQSLRDGDVEVLVATDLAGRGIDVPDVTCVINWQMASTIEKYVHRIGRTGRAGKTGIAITFLGNEDEETMYDLKQEISKSPISTLSQELAHHPAARQRITREMKRKRDDED